MRRLAVIGLAPILLIGCGSAPDVPEPVVRAIRSAPSAERIHAINDAAHRHPGHPSSLTPLLEEQDADVRWAAAYVAALWAKDLSTAATLVPLLRDDDETIRAVVAGSLAGLRHGEARDVLAALRTSSTPMPFSDPRETVGQFATRALSAIDRAGVAP